MGSVLSFFVIRKTEGSRIFVYYKQNQPEMIFWTLWHLQHFLSEVLFWKIFVLKILQHSQETTMRVSFFVLYHNAEMLTLPRSIILISVALVSHDSSKYTAM